MSGTNGKKEFNSSFNCIAKVYLSEELLAFYNGLSAGFLRQSTYTTARMEVEAYHNRFERQPTVLASPVMGMFAEAWGAMFGNPAEVALICMMFDNSLPEAERRNCKNVSDALVSIVWEKRLFALCRGYWPTVGRGMAVDMV
ncbi:mitochondrial 2-oxoglutarate/malate carrier protein-like [Drosophila tropicalis]|uniref:mitochondrial 2-oxoglutarate/malate carrier protein-like n=1 Tax=Drosophila tropicalis TaxID=46794 RepID=UPI0035ABAD6C